MMEIELLTEKFPDLVKVFMFAEEGVAKNGKMPRGAADN